MKKYAILDENNIVLNIFVADDNWQQENCVAYTDENPAYIGGDYVDNYFYAPQPYPSWTRNNGNWQSPTPRPDGMSWRWDEDTLSWIEIEA